MFYESLPKLLIMKIYMRLIVICQNCYSLEKDWELNEKWISVLLLYNQLNILKHYEQRISA